MNVDDYQKLLGEISHLKRMVGSMFRPATVKAIGGPKGDNGDLLRVVLGQDKDGKEILGPWLHSANHRGGERERRFFNPANGQSAGQNVMLCCPGGDIAQAFILTYSPNKDNKPPDHANNSGTGEATRQQGNLRFKETDGGFAVWFQEPQQGGGGQGAQSHVYQQGEQTQAPARQPQSPTAEDVAFAANKGKSGTLRYGTKRRIMVSEKGTMMKVKDDHATITEDGALLVSKPWEIGEAIEIDDTLAG